MFCYLCVEVVATCVSLFDCPQCQGPSMLPTLSDAGDVLMVDKLSMRWNPLKRNDIVVAKSPHRTGEDVCKRVLGMVCRSSATSVFCHLCLRQTSVTVSMFWAPFITCVHYLLDSTARGCGTRSNSAPKYCFDCELTLHVLSFCPRVSSTTCSSVLGSNRFLLAMCG
jgi:hypothetical protein